MRRGYDTRVKGVLTLVSCHLNYFTGGVLSGPADTSLERMGNGMFSLGTRGGPQREMVCGC